LLHGVAQYGVSSKPPVIASHSAALASRSTGELSAGVFSVTWLMFVLRKGCARMTRSGANR
jgi:hypothetical protein